MNGADAPPAPAAPAFVAADTFGGAKFGYVFKMGEMGLGYYADALAADTLIEGAASQLVSKMPREQLRTMLADVSDGAAPAAADSAAADAAAAQPPAEPFDDIRQAGGDVMALWTLARQDNRSELSAQLKALGFKSLRARQRLEAELKAWRGY